MEWKIISNYPDYAINESGDVKSLRFNRMLKPSTSDSGYNYVNLVCNKIKKTTAIHKLVMEHFGPSKPTNHSIVDHKDRNKSNNHIKNLEWVSIKENTLRYYGNQNKKEEAINLRLQGKTLSEIAKQINMSVSFVHQATLLD